MLVDIPRNIQLAPVEFAAWPEPGTAAASPKAQVPALEQALALLQAAQRPGNYGRRGAGLARNSAGL